MFENSSTKTLVVAAIKKENEENPLNPFEQKFNSMLNSPRNSIEIDEIPFKSRAFVSPTLIAVSLLSFGDNCTLLKNSSSPAAELYMLHFYAAFMKD